LMVPPETRIAIAVGKLIIGQKHAV